MRELTGKQSLGKSFSSAFNRFSHFKVAVEYLSNKKAKGFSHGAIEVEGKWQGKLIVEIVLGYLLDERDVLVGDFVGMLSTGCLVGVLLYRNVAHFE